MAKKGDNLGPNEAPFYDAKAKEILRRADTWRDIEINEKNADQITADINDAAELRKAADKDRKALVDPFIAGQRRVNDDFKPVISRIGDAETFMKSRLSVHLRELRAKQEREAREKRAAAEKAKREALALADDPLVGREVQRESYAKTAEATRAERATPLARPAGGGRAVGLKKRRYARITDAKALVMHFAAHPSIVDEAERLANAAIRAARGGPVNIPGVEVVEDDRA